MNRYKEVKKASVLGILGNIFLLIIKLIIAIITRSRAMIADAFNSAGDIFSSLMTLIGNKIASKPSDEDHNLGHGKAEYIFSLLISVIMIATSLIIIKDGIISLVNNTKYNYSSGLIIVCLVTILIKLSLFLYTSKIAKKQNNLLMKANSKDHINDCLLTTCSLISVIFAYNNIYFVDSIVGIGISLYIIISSINIFIESYDVLMDKSISEDEKNQVLSIVNRHKEIKKINHFNSTPVGYKYQISLTIFVDGKLSTFDSHKIADNLEKEIIKKIDSIYLAVIHVNPVECEHEK